MAKKEPIWIRNRIPFSVPVDIWLYNNQNHRRFRVFYNKGVTCVKCGAIGVEIVKWIQTYKWDGPSIHFDLITADGTLMTVDHIWPKCLGGNRELDNLQPMCAPCNESKGDKVDPEVEAYIKSLGEVNV